MNGGDERSLPLAARKSDARARGDTSRRRTRPDEFPAFRAAVEERLRAIEREVAEAKQRINALLLMFAGTVASALGIRISEWLG